MRTEGISRHVDWYTVFQQHTLPTDLTRLQLQLHRPILLGNFCRIVTSIEPYLKRARADEPAALDSRDTA